MIKLKGQVSLEFFFVMIVSVGLVTYLATQIYTNVTDLSRLRDGGVAKTSLDAVALGVNELITGGNNSNLVMQQYFPRASCLYVTGDSKHLYCEVGLDYKINSTIMFTSNAVAIYVNDSCRNNGWIALNLTRNATGVFVNC